MDSKKKIISIGSFIILLLVALIFFSVSKPLVYFHLIGKNEITVEVNTKYEDQGVVASIGTIFNKGKKMTVNKVTNININKIGDYVVNYKISNHNLKKKLTRKVHVVDETAPEITVLDDEINICKNNSVKPLSYLAYDNYDGNITKKVKEKMTEDNIILSVTDKSGNKTSKKIKYNIIDEENPKIFLFGDENISIILGDEYIEYGAYAYDSCDGDISSNIKIVNNVNNQIPGKYIVTYEVTDSAKKTATITRNVNVVYPQEEVVPDVPKGATIYLTFDDGPGQYTEELLKILKKYKIKATFFVTNQFPKYQYVIKKEYEQGHTVGVHTYSHLWSIYNSVSDYVNDFNLINQIIYDQTGSYSKIFRFPGGSSNTISKKYSRGVITDIADKMISEGYQYYDWNIDSTDTARNNTVSSIIENTRKQLKGNSYYYVLMHDIKKNTIEALPSVIEYAKSIGYEFKPITKNSPIVHSKISN